jgi:hypothetical protein
VTTCSTRDSGLCSLGSSGDVSARVMVRKRSLGPPSRLSKGSANRQVSQRVCKLMTALERLAVIRRRQSRPWGRRRLMAINFNASKGAILDNAN